MHLRNRQTAYIGIGALVTIIGIVCIAVAIWYAVINLTAGNDAAQHTNTESQLALNLGLAAPVNTSGAPLKSLISVYPGRFVNPKFWDTPQNLGGEPFGIAKIGAEFTRVDLSNRNSVPELGINITDAQNISIPAINVNSGVYDLRLNLQEDGTNRYENPIGVVGFIPETGDPGEKLNGWYFGHLESLGEGNVFRHLPRITELVRNDPVDIFISTDTHEFVYRVNATYDVHRDDLFDDLFLPSLNLNETNYSVYLCTCWPPRNYTRRVVIKAELIGFRGLV